MNSPNIVVPLAGTDTRFENLGNHKVLTNVFGKTVLEWIAGARPYDLSKAIFVLLREHDRLYSIRSRLNAIFNKEVRVVWAEQRTDGAPQSVLLASSLIDSDAPLLIDLIDQFLDCRGLGRFLASTDADGVIPTFESLYYNRGYMELDAAGTQVVRVSEKDSVPISTHSTACISYFRHGGDFVRASRRMIHEKHVAANGAYLVSMAYNELIAEKKLIRTCPCDLIATLGSLEGLRCFEQLVRPVTYTPDDLVA